MPLYNFKTSYTFKPLASASFTTTTVGSCGLHGSNCSRNKYDTSYSTLYYEDTYISVWCTLQNDNCLSNLVVKDGCFLSSYQLKNLRVSLVCDAYIGLSTSATASTEVNMTSATSSHQKASK